MGVFCVINYANITLKYDQVDIDFFSIHFVTSQTRQIMNKLKFIDIFRDKNKLKIWKD